MENKFKKGLLLGGLLSVAALIGFSMTKRGKDLSADIQESLKELTHKVKDSLADLEDVTKEKFDEIVSSITKEYAKAKGLAADVEASLAETLQEKWAEMEEAYTKNKE